MLRIERRSTAELAPDEIRRLRALLHDAFGDDEEAFDEDDWQHALGGVHVLALRDDEIVGHAAVVERELHVDALPLRTGYVEAVAIAPRFQRRGHGSLVMREVAEIISEGYELGALGTGVQPFYEALRWERWRGPTYVRTDRDRERTPDEDDGILVLRTPLTPALDLDAPISCEWRIGDVW